ncbi:MAG TPA: hypothetical protein PKX15_05690 [Bacteroidales bacterium]|nr:hypothetical protein [Bacteroidales bacterium]
MKIPKTKKITLKQIIENVDKIPSTMGELKKLTPDQKKQLLEMACTFEEFGKVFHNMDEILNTTKNLVQFHELAETYALTECQEWFDQSIVKRNFQEAKKKVMEFQKLANECHRNQVHLKVLYEDLMFLYERYYDTTPKAKKDAEKVVQLEDLERICAWCKKPMGTSPSDSSGTTHGICPECMEKFKKT